MMIDLDAYPIVNPDIISEKIGDEIVLVLPVKGKVSVLNSVAARIWSLCGNSISVRDIVQNIFDEYEIEYDEAETDVIEFIDDLIRRDVVSLVVEKPE